MANRDSAHDDGLTRSRIREHILHELAGLEQVDSDQLAQVLHRPEYDLEIDSRLAVWVIARVEKTLGHGDLATPADLDPEKLTTVNALAQLLHDRLPSQTQS